jgi:hypothetical protein
MSQLVPVREWDSPAAYLSWVRERARAPRPVVPEPPPPPLEPVRGWMPLSPEHKKALDYIATRNPAKIKRIQAEELEGKTVNVLGGDPRPMTIEDIKGPSKTLVIARTRQKIMWRMRNELTVEGADGKMRPMSYPDIGQRIGGRDHSTVIHACRATEAEINGTPIRRTAGTTTRGYRKPKYTAEQIAAIRRDYTLGMTQVRVAVEHGIPLTAAARLCRGLKRLAPQPREADGRMAKWGSV